MELEKINGVYIQGTISKTNKNPINIFKTLTEYTALINSSKIQ